MQQVCGVPQNAVGWIAGGRLTGSRGWVLVAGWNIGNGAVIAGTLTGSPYVVDLGGVVLLVPMVVLLGVLLRDRGVDGVPSDRAESGAERAARWALIVLSVVLIVSIPIGLALAHLRAG